MALYSYRQVRHPLLHSPLNRVLSSIPSRTAETVGRREEGSEIEIHQRLDARHVPVGGLGGMELTTITMPLRISAMKVWKWTRNCWSFLVAVLMWRIPRSCYTRLGLYLQSGFILLCGTAYLFLPIYLHHPIYTGYAIAALGVQAVIMTVRGRFTKVEQVVWVIIAFFLFVGEIHVIDQDRTEQDAANPDAQAQQRIQFWMVLKQDQNEFGATMKRSDALYKVELGTTDLALHTLEETEGGDGYCWLTAIPPLFLRRRAILRGR